MIKTPHLSVDGIVKVYKDNKYQGIVLIERKNRPLGVALPGGFVDIGERVEDALVREMREEISVDVEIESLLGVYSDPSRDDRFHTVSVVYICSTTQTPKADDDAKDLGIYMIDEIDLDSLCFDHSEILNDYIKSLNN
jgi:8-oxo-dGTP diphosphatase